jgi:glycosyltransferase involved in cell wall biosynthesis
MKSTPLFSIIIPARNEEKYINNCLASLFSQSFNKKDYEVIVVDNNSTDRTAEIVTNYPAVYTKEESIGCIYALIKGVKLAKGAILVIGDSDCIYPPKWLQNIYSTFTSYPEIVAVGGRVQFYDGDILLDLLTRLYLKFSRNIRGFDFALKKDFLQKIGGLNPEINFGWDTALFNKIKKKGSYKIDNSNIMYASSRRYRSCFFSTMLLQLLNSISLKFRGKGIFFKFPSCKYR